MKSIGYGAYDNYASRQFAGCNCKKRKKKSRALGEMSLKYPAAAGGVLLGVSLLWLASRRLISSGG